MISDEQFAEIGKLVDDEDRDEALRRLLPFLDEEIDDPKALFMAGYIFIKSDKVGLAYQCFRRSIELAPKVDGSWLNLGKCFHELRRLGDAEKCFRKALEITPTHSAAMSNIGLLFLNRSDYKEAIEWADKAVEADPEGAPSTDARINRGMAYLALGQWKEGWDGYNLNIGTIKDRKELVYGKEVRWDGAKGKRVVCYGEQGIGDEISFASCLPDIIRDSESVTIECDRRLEGLFQRSFPETIVHGTRYDKSHTWKGDFDFRVALGQLPQFYRLKNEDFPGTPYLISSPEKRVQWRALLASLGTRPKVGIAWSGGRPHTWQSRRSLSLDSLLPILRQNCVWVSLQYEKPKDLETFKEKTGITIHHWDWGVENYDYDQTAALVSELDLVISVTTTVVHLAGGLGVECWCLVPQRVMWRYMTEGSWFPWAKSVTLFRQNGELIWPIEEVAEKLKARLNECSDELHPRRLQAVR